MWGFMERRPRQKIDAWAIWAAALLALFGVAVFVAFHYYTSLLNNVRQHEGEYLAAVADAKAGQIGKWRAERMADVSSISADEAMAQVAQRFIAQSNEADRAVLQKWIEALRRSSDCRSVNLCDTAGHAVLLCGDENRRMGCLTQTNVLWVCRTQHPWLSDLHRGRDVVEIHLDLITPLLLSHGNSTSVVAAVLLRLDPALSIYPVLLRRWPVNSTTESMLVRRDDDSVLFLSNQQNYPQAALSLRIPLSNTNILAAFAIQQTRSGVFQSHDYRGVAVLGATHPVPNSPWLVIVKKDLCEVDASIRQQARLETVIMLVLLLAIVGVITTLWQRKRRQSDSERAAWKMRYELATAAAGQVTYEYDPTNDNILWGGSVMQVFGYEPEEMGRTVRQIIEIAHPDDRECVRRHFKTNDRTHAHHDAEYRLRHKNGQYILVRDQGLSFQSDDDHATWHVIGMQTDITERRRISDALRRNEERFRLLFEKMHEGFALLEVVNDFEGRPFDCRFLEVNFAFQQLVGKSSQDLVGRSMRESLPLLAEEWIGKCTPVATGGSPIYFKSYIPDFKRWYAITAFSPIRGQIATICEDITEQNRLEEQFRHVQKFDAIGRLAGGVAHDFNNILTAMIGYTDMLFDRADLSKESRLLVENIRRAGERATALTRQLLIFSKKQTVKVQVIDVNKLVADLRQMLRPLIGENIRLETNLQPNIGHVRADAGQIEQVLLNLAINARDAMPKGGTIHIRTSDVNLTERHVQQHPESQAGPHVLITVADTGSGMSRDVLSHIFEPFFTTKETGKGSGLGLATAYGIVRQSGGHIVVESQENRGSMFHIYLPRVSAPLTVDAAPAPLATPPPTGATGTILVVEDEPIVRQLAASILLRAGYTVLEASDGEQALQIVARHGLNQIDLVFSDIIMPGMDGRALAARLHQQRPDLPVLYASGYVSDNLLSAQDAALLLPKPYTPSVLIIRIRAMLDTRSSRAVLPQTPV